MFKNPKACNSFLSAYSKARLVWCQSVHERAPPPNPTHFSGDEGSKWKTFLLHVMTPEHLRLWSCDMLYSSLSLPEHSRQWSRLWYKCIPQLKMAQLYVNKAL